MWVYIPLTFMCIFVPRDVFFFPFLYHCKSIVKDVFIFVVVQSWVSYSTIFYTSTPVRLLMKGLCYLLSTELLGFKNVHIYTAQWPFSLLGLAFFSLVSFSYEGQLLEWSFITPWKFLILVERVLLFFLSKHFADL